MTLPQIGKPWKQRSASGFGTNRLVMPRDVQMRVRIAAPGVSDERLRALVEESCRRSPMACALQDAVPVALHIELES